MSFEGAKSHSIYLYVWPTVLVKRVSFVCLYTTLNAMRIVTRRPCKWVVCVPWEMEVSNTVIHHLFFVFFILHYIFCLVVAGPNSFIVNPDCSWCLFHFCKYVFVHARMHRFLGISATYCVWRLVVRTFISLSLYLSRSQFIRYFIDSDTLHAYEQVDTVQCSIFIHSWMSSSHVSNSVQNVYITNEW